jgi:serine/threonine protein kinase
MVYQGAKKEAGILCLLRHPNIVPFVGIVEGSHQFLLVSEWMEHGHIMDYLKIKPNAPKNELVRVT